MRTNFLRGAVRAVTALSLAICAAETRAETPSEISELRALVRKMEERLEESRTRQQAEIESLKQKLRALTEGSSGTPASTTAKVESPSPATGIAGSAPAARGAFMNMSFNTQIVGGYSTEPEPTERLELGDHDPQKRGFSLRNAELAIDGAVDPYFKGFANVVLKLDENDETEIELEESYLQTTSLPGNVRLKAGQMFASFGRHNAQHPHQWAFVDQPIILNRSLGPDGLRNIGTEASWLLPTSFYSEAFLGIFDSQGETAFGFRNPGEDDESGVSRVHGRATTVHALRGAGDLLFVPRMSSSVDLTDTQTLVAGLSGAFGPNSTGSGMRTQIYGGDLYYKWKPANATSGYPFVAFQTEALFSRFEAGEDLEASIPLMAETLKDYGAYSQLLWGIKNGWVVGLRGEYADGNTGEFDEEDPYRGERFRLSPVLTYFPSEFSKLRLQYNFDEGESFSDASSLWMQVEFNLGAHGAHKF